MWLHIHNTYCSLDCILETLRCAMYEQIGSHRLLNGEHQQTGSWTAILLDHVDQSHITISPQNVYILCTGMCWCQYVLWQLKVLSHVPCIWHACKICTHVYKYVQVKNGRCKFELKIVANVISFNGILYAMQKIEGNRLTWRWKSDWHCGRDESLDIPKG